MKQDMIVILDLGSTENTVVARAIRDMGVYSEIHPHDITVDGLKALDLSLIHICLPSWPLKPGLKTGKFPMAELLWA